MEDFLKPDSIAGKKILRDSMRSVSHTSSYLTYAYFFPNCIKYCFEMYLSQDFFIQSFNNCNFLMSIALKLFSGFVLSSRDILINIA